MSKQVSLLDALAVSFLLSFSITFAIIFNMAFLNEGTTLVDINKYSEMWLEMVVFNLIGWPIISVAIAKWHNSTRSE